MNWLGVTMKTFNPKPGAPGSTVTVTVHVVERYGSDVWPCKRPSGERLPVPWCVDTVTVEGCVVFLHPRQPYRWVALWDGLHPVAVELNKSGRHGKRDYGHGTVSLSVEDAQRRGLG